MEIYKITNLKNNKVYIGQTINTINQRFQRHMQDALSNRLNTHLARAIRKYGKESFIIESIDSAINQEELNQKEYYWIHFYNAIENGYNETDSIFKSGGNTYKGKTEKEMAIIKNKLSKSKIGGKNPNARKVKCKNYFTNEEYHFNSLSEMKSFFNEKNHSFITKRCNGTTKCLYKKIWLIAYEENDYNNFQIEKNNRKSVSVQIKDLESQEVKTFQSYTSAEKYYNFIVGSLSKLVKDKTKIYDINNKYQLKILN